MPVIRKQKRKRTPYERPESAKRIRYESPSSAIIYPSQRGLVRTGGYYGGIEKKFLDTDIGTAIGAINSSMEFSNLNVIIQGDTESNRNGRKVLVKSIHLKGLLKLDSSADSTNTSNKVKLMIVLDKQTNGTQFTALDLLKTNSIHSFSNLANRQRFKILWSKEYVIGVSGAVQTGAAYRFGEGVRNLKANIKVNIPIEYDNSLTTGAISTQKSNSICFCAIAEDANTCSLTGTARIRFTDM